MDVGAVTVERTQIVDSWEHKSEPNARLQFLSFCGPYYGRIGQMRQEDRFGRLITILCLFDPSVIMAAMDSLPAHDLISAGLVDLQHQRETIPAFLVAIGAPKLRALGLGVPATLPSNPEHRLYDLLARNGTDSAHSRYNALIRKLVSFQRAMECVKK